MKYTSFYQYTWISKNTLFHVLQRNCKLVILTILVVLVLTAHCRREDKRTLCVVLRGNCVRVNLDASASKLIVRSKETNFQAVDRRSDRVRNVSTRSRRISNSNFSNKTRFIQVTKTENDETDASRLHENSHRERPDDDIGPISTICKRWTDLDHS